MTYDQRIAASKGCKVLTGTGDHTSLGADAFIVQEDTVIGTFEVDGADAKAAYGIDTDPTLKAGAYITVPEQETITAITMSSGSVIIYNG
jgi:hypothetical protein